VINGRERALLVAGFNVETQRIVEDIQDRQNLQTAADWNMKVRSGLGLRVPTAGRAPPRGPCVSVESHYQRIPCRSGSFFLATVSIQAALRGENTNRSAPVIMRRLISRTSIGFGFIVRLSEGVP
jgi:hypothetical protein